jgi:hypothetical protein
VSLMPDNFSSVSREQVTEVCLKAIQLIDDRVAPLLGRVTTRVLVQGAAKRVVLKHPFLSCFINRPYTDIDVSILQEQLSGVTVVEIASGMNDLLNECFAGLRELTGDLIVPPLHEEILDHLRQLQ